MTDKDKPAKHKMLNIIPIKTNKKKVIHNNFDIIPSFPRRCIFVAPTGSGKSVVIVNLLTRKRYLRNFYDVIIFYSPNVHYEEEHDEIKLKNSKAEIKFEEEFKTNEFKAKVNSSSALFHMMISRSELSEKTPRGRSSRIWRW